MKIIQIKSERQEKIIKEAVKALRSQGLIVYPTETCYGLGADVTSQRAIDKLLRFKGQRKNKPISIAVTDEKMARQYVKINQTAENIYHHFLPGPITVVSQSRRRVDPRLESQQATLGIRIPNYPLILSLIQAFGRPITSTSANVSGGKIPYSIKDLLNQLSENKKQLLDLILDAGRLPRKPPSSVVDTTLNEPTLLRRGEIDFDKLGAKSVITNSPEETQKLAQQLLEKNFSLLKEKALLFALQGELGAGKTQFAKGLGQGLKINQSITSPTFIIVKEYPYQLDQTTGIFYHIDAWRLADTNQNLEFIREYLHPRNIIALEWIQKGKKILEELVQNSQVKIVWIEILHLGDTKRQIRFTT